MVHFVYNVKFLHVSSTCTRCTHKQTNKLKRQTNKHTDIYWLTDRQTDRQTTDRKTNKPRKRNIWHHKYQWLQIAWKFSLRNRYISIFFPRRLMHNIICVLMNQSLVENMHSVEFYKVFLWQCILHRHKYYACNVFYLYTDLLQFISAKPGRRTDWRIYLLWYQCKLNACNMNLVEFGITITNNKRCCYVMSIPYVCILPVQLEGYWGGFCCYLKPCAGSTPRDGLFIAAYVSSFHIFIWNVLDLINWMKWNWVYIHKRIVAFV